MKANVLTPPFSSVLPRRKPSAWNRITEAMRQQPLWAALIIPALIIAVLGRLDFMTGWEVSLFIFYALPITLAVWWARAKGGLIAAMFSGVAWWYANETSHPYQTEIGYWWALLNREFYFCVVVFAVMAVRTRQEMDAAQITLLEERRRLEHDIVMVSEYEQQRIGQDLHDGLCQQLAAIGCAVHALAEDLQLRGQPEALDAVHVEQAIQLAVMEARSLARGIFPVHVDRSGLSMALTDLAKTTSRLTSLPIRVSEAVEVHIDNPEVAMHLYRIAQEAVANAVRHGRASDILIALTATGNQLELRIEDNGQGFAKPDGRPLSHEGMGLRTMQYRADSVGAQLTITPREGGGSVVICRLKVKPYSDNE